MVLVCVFVLFHKRQKHYFVTIFFHKIEAVVLLMLSLEQSPLKAFFSESQLKFCKHR